VDKPNHGVIQEDQTHTFHRLLSVQIVRNIYVRICSRYLSNLIYLLIYGWALVSRSQTNGRQTLAISHFNRDKERSL